MKAARALPVFMYHHVSPAPGLVTVAPATFRKHVAALAEAGWRTAGLAELAAFLAGAEVPARTCVLTFDDGYLDNFVHAHPILAEFGMRAVLFVVTAWLGDGAVRSGANAEANHAQCMKAVADGRTDEVMLRWSEVEAMRTAGTFEFHSHTHTHRRWDRDVADVNARRDALIADLEASRCALGQRLGETTEHLCWPQGHHDDLYRQGALAAGFKYLYTTEKKVVTPSADPLQIGRIVTKERPGAWLLSRARWFSHPWLGRAYTFIQRGAASE